MASLYFRAICSTQLLLGILLYDLQLNSFSRDKKKKNKKPIAPGHPQYPMRNKKK